jgi:hypothetical protein
MALTDFTAGLNSVFLDLVVVTDALTRRTARLVKSLEVLIADINALGARPGVRVARLALKHCAPDTDSCPETWVRLAMLDAGLPAGIPNVVVASSSGGPKRFIDVGLEGYKIGVEYHGVYHFESNEQAYEDMRRREQLRALGWTIIEACRDDLPNQFRLIQRIAAETARAEGVRLPGGAPA